MLGLLVTAQVDLALKSAPTEVAGEGFVAGVLARVRDEVAALRERLAAHDALVRFLTCTQSMKTIVNVN